MAGLCAGLAYRLTPHPDSLPERRLEVAQSLVPLVPAPLSPPGTGRESGAANTPAPVNTSSPLQVRSEPAKLERCASRPATLKLLEPPPAGPYFGGQIALFVARFDPITLEPTKAVMLNPDAPFPLASTYKQSVLWALLRQIDAGQVSWTEKFSVTRANQSLGGFPYDRSSVRQLAERMIGHSDNTATDILHRRIGLEAPQRIADELGLCKTRLLLPTKAWWTAQAGGDPDHFPPFGRLKGAEKFAGGSRPLQLEIAHALDAKAQALPADKLQRMLDRYFDGPYYDPKIDQQTQNATTAFEWATLMAHEFLQNGLSDQGNAVLGNIMNLGVGKGYVRSSVPLVKFGGKTGNGWRIFTASGYVQTQAGEHIVYVLLNQASPRTYTVTPGYMRSAYAWIVRGIQAIQQDDALEAKGLPSKAVTRKGVGEVARAQSTGAVQANAPQNDAVAQYQKLIGTGAR